MPDWYEWINNLDSVLGFVYMLMLEDDNESCTRSKII